MESRRRNRIVKRGADLLAQAAEPDRATLEEMLTDCAAEALSVRAAILKRSRRIHDLGGESTWEAAGEERQVLTSENKRAHEDWQELSELITELRARHRAASGGASGGRAAAGRD